MPRYELPDEASGKYWEITLKGRVVSTRSGKVGLGPASEWQGRMHFSERRGRVTERELPDVATAKREFERLIAAKRREGYKLVDGVDPDAPLVDAEVLVNAELEAAIREAPDDHDPYLVYADWLQSKGDPRGEFIAMQHGMRNHTDPGQFMIFKKREEVLRKTHQHLWLGTGVSACDYRLKLEWRNGFVVSARIDSSTHPGELPVAALVAAFLASPCGRLVRELTLRGGPEIAGLPAELPPTLKRITLEVSESTTTSVDHVKHALAQRSIHVVTVAAPRRLD